MYDQYKSQQSSVPAYKQPHEEENQSIDPLMQSADEQEAACGPAVENELQSAGSAVLTKATWHPENNSDGNRALVASEGDNLETLKAYLAEIYGSEDKIPKEEWDSFAEQIKFIEANCPGIQGQQICSEKGTFDNLVGIYLVTKSEKDPAWGYFNPANVANACSPSLANRSALAVKFVYGEESTAYKKLNLQNKMQGYIGYHQFQNNYGPGIEHDNGKGGVTTGEELYKKRNAASYGLTDQMRRHSVGGAVEYSGAGEYVPEDKVWSGGLKPGAAIGLGSHTGIFIRYEYKDGKIIDIWYWDHHNEVKRVKEDDGYNVRIGGNWF